MGTCPNCGAPVMDGARFCEKCGTNLAATVPPTQSPTQVVPAQGQYPPQGYAYPQRLRDNWSAGTVTALSAVTFGFYGGWFASKISTDSDVSCAGDGVAPTTGGKKAASILFWPYTAYLSSAVLKRFTNNAARYGIMPGADESGKAAAAYVIGYLSQFLARAMPTPEMLIVSIVIWVVCLYVWSKTMVTNANTFAQAYNARMGL